MKNLLSALLIIPIYLQAFDCLSINNQATSTLIEDPRNRGVDLSVYCTNLLDSKIIVVDVLSVGLDKSTADVFRVLFQIAENLKEKQFERVYLASKGSKKFFIDGEYFYVLGSSFSSQNPIYLLRTFPENTYLLEGTKAFPTWTGGVLGVLGKQMDDLNSLAKDWFMEDILN